MTAPDAFGINNYLYGLHNARHAPTYEADREDQLLKRWVHSRVGHRVLVVLHEQVDEPAHYLLFDQDSEEHWARFQELIDEGEISVEAHPVLLAFLVELIEHPRDDV